jgi:hypothetical protein
MNILDFYTQAGKETKHNEDKIGFSKNMVWLMDGATPMQETIKNNYNSDAAWLVHHLDGLFRKNSVLGLQICLEKSLKEAEKHYNSNLCSNFELYQYLMPSAQYVGVEHLKSQKLIRIACVGDTRILVKYKNNEVKVFGETILDEIDERVLSITKTKEDKLDSYDISKRIELGRDLINENRQNYMNQENGFFTLTPSQQIVKLNGISYFTFNEDEVDSILMATDGLLSIVESYKKMTYEDMFSHIEKNSIAHLTKMIRDIEEEDKEGKIYYRFKKSDDTSGVLLDFKS